MGIDTMVGYVLPKAPTPEQFTVMNVDMYYRNSFVDDKDFENKRFNRYVEKAKKYIEDQYLKVLYPHCFNSKVYTMNDFIISLFRAYYFTEERNAIIKPPFFEAFHEYSVKMTELFDMDSDLVAGYLMADYEPKYKEFSLHTVVEDEIKKVCKEFIKQRSIEMVDDVDESNYFITLPNSTQDAIWIFDKIINYVFIDIEHMCVMGDTYISVMENGLRDEADKKIDALDDENTNLKATIASKDDEITKLKGQIRALQESAKPDDYAESLLERIFSQDRQITKLMDKYNGLLSKYEKLKETAHVDIKDDESLIPLKEPDRNGKYLFIAHEKASFQNNVLEMFPNAVFATSNENVHAGSVDMVVIITSHITHPVYYGMKQQCKEKNIPFVHCPFTNVELIKGCMMDCLN